MTFGIVSNIMTMLLCIAVLIQSVRLMRAFDAVKGGALTDVVGALDASTIEARRVLGKLTELLRGDLAVTARTISEGKAMIDELTVMTGIANAIAERIMDAAGASNRKPAVPVRKVAAPERKPKAAPADRAGAVPTPVQPASVAALPAPAPALPSPAAALQPTRRARLRAGIAS